MKQINAGTIFQISRNEFGITTGVKLGTKYGYKRIIITHELFAFTMCLCSAEYIEIVWKDNGLMIIDTDRVLIVNLANGGGIESADYIAANCIPTRAGAKIRYV